MLPAISRFENTRKLNRTQCESANLLADREAVASKSLAIHIRTATRKDIEAILQCLHEAFEPYKHDYTEGAFADTVLNRKALETRFSEMTILVALDPGDQLIGTVAYRVMAEVGHIRGMAVVPPFQGRGVSSALLRRVEELLKGERSSYVTLDTTIPLMRATRFYETHGFSPTGRIESFFGMELLQYRKSL